MAPVTAFGLALWTQLVKLGALSGSGGSFISPLSAWLALVLALNGAGASRRPVHLRQCRGGSRHNMHLSHVTARMHTFAHHS